MNVVVEGITDESVLRRILRMVGITPSRVIVAGGKPAMIQRIANYNRAAATSRGCALWTTTAIPGVQLNSLPTTFRRDIRNCFYESRCGQSRHG
jgi:hypothetical protein